MAAVYHDGDSQELYINGKRVPHGHGISIKYSPPLPEYLNGSKQYESMAIERLPLPPLGSDNLHDTYSVTTVQVLDDTLKRYHYRIGNFPKVKLTPQNDGGCEGTCFRDESGAYGSYTDVEVDFEEFLWY